MNETWALELWSGTLGALVSAVAAALVALAVLYWSNKHQTTLAKKARIAASRDLIRQMNLQRSEASRERATQAIGIFISEIDSKVFRLKDEEIDSAELVEMRTKLTTAAARWGMEISNDAMQRELLSWPSLLFRLCRKVGTSSAPRDDWAALAVASSAFRQVAMQWYSLDATGQAEAVKKLYDAHTTGETWLAAANAQKANAEAAVRENAKEESASGFVLRPESIEQESSKA